VHVGQNIDCPSDLLLKAKQEHTFICGLHVVLPVPKLHQNKSSESLFFEIFRKKIENKMKKTFSTN